MPSQAEMRNTITGYFCELVDQGKLQPQVKRLVRAETSPVNCGPLGQEPGSNFICGGEMRFVGRGDEMYTITFSPTLRRQGDGSFALYDGDDEEGRQIWRVPAPRSTSKTCAGR
jgi:hypothetical protein